MTHMQNCRRTIEIRITSRLSIAAKSRFESGCGGGGTQPRIPIHVRCAQPSLANDPQRVVFL